MGTQFINLIISFLLTFITCWSIIRLKKIFPDKSTVHSNQPQKIHIGEITRVGGLALIISISITLPFENLSLINTPACLSLISIFAIGYYEEITHSISAKNRLILITAISLLTVITQKLILLRLDIMPLDELLKIPLIAIIFSVFSITGMTNAYIIIDGLNWLAVILATIAIASMTYLAHQAGLHELVVVNLIVIFAMLGFLLWKFPGGKIFLGDGGTYLIGFITSCIAIYTSNQLPTFSPWFFVIINIYPIVETLSSMYRRWVSKSLKAIYPDFNHMHSLIYTRIKKIECTKAVSSELINFLASLIITISSLCITLLSFHIKQSTTFLLLVIILYLLAYIRIYEILNTQKPLERN
jgi:UDP-N-acetylmuramyl pentapeptide phosphotransferase/UDP-N-acetylglucosamine-1-phosphate transferase